MEKFPLPTEELDVIQLKEVNESAVSEADGEEKFHTPLRLAVRGPVSSGATDKGKS